MSGSIRPIRSLKERVQLMERRAIERAMTKSGGNQAHAARILGMNRTALVMRLKKYRKIFYGFLW